MYQNKEFQKKKLKAHGIARLKREGRSHEIWEPWLGGQSVPIPRHDGMDLPKGTLRGILKQHTNTSVFFDQ